MRQPPAEHSYPPGPSVVPEGLTRPTAAYKRHAWLALVCLVLFVTLWVFLAYWFGRTAYRTLAGALSGSGSSLLGFIVGGVAALLCVFLVKALFSVTRGGKATDVEVTAEQEPELFRFLNRLADETGAPRPHRVFLSPHVNAAVFYDLSPLNLLFPSKKNLEIGLGLVNALTLGDLKAVLAHEFGHFAQRSMAVGRWVYVAQQIASHIVGRRDWFDKGLAFLSAIDLRVAWLGWIIRLIVWSLRALLETAFSGVILAQRALSREMEFQADLVAVSVTGSDALVHALHRLGAADQAWDRALEIASVERAKGKNVPDLFAIQTRISEHLRVILDDEKHGKPPALPDQDRASHRVFEEKLAQAPRMWSTHPTNREREDNVKRHYVEAPLDDRPAWILFGDPPELCARMTAHVLGQLESESEVKTSTQEEALASVDQRFASIALDRRYRGAYLRRSAVLDAARVSDLYDAPPEPSSLARELAELYPASLSERLKRLRDLEEEHASLEALRDGILTAPGGVIRHRGRSLKKRDLPGAILSVKDERDRTKSEISDHDRACRTLHRAAAERLGKGWPEYLRGLVELLHYAGHSEADVDDARGHLANVFSVVIADGRVSQAERNRLVTAANELHGALFDVHRRADEVLLPPDVLKRLEVDSWKEALPKRFDMGSPSAENIGEWMAVMDSWYQAVSGPLSVLERGSLEALLAAESKVGSAFLSGTDPGEAPPAGRVPPKYTTRVTGTERERQRRLGLWDRFITADGSLPTLARLGVALAIVGSVLGFGGSVGSPSVVVYNGLGEWVRVSLGSDSRSVEPGGNLSFKVSSSSRLSIVATTRAGVEIESFEADASRAATYVYNVAGASPLVEWTASYGAASEQAPRPLGNERWLTSNADFLFAEPPKSVSTKGGGATRLVIEGMAEAPPWRMLAELRNQKERNALIAAHARWDGTDSAHVMDWLGLATPLPDFPAIVRDRLARDPRDIPALRAEQDAKPTRTEACVRHRVIAAASPQDENLVYIAIRCIEDASERGKRFIEAHRRHPNNGWLAYAAGHELSDRRTFREAMQALVVASRAPALRAVSALTIQRLQRASPDDVASLDELMNHSAPLKQLVSLETGQDVPDGPYRAYSLLGLGELSQAVERASGEPDLHARVLRLAAASDGAPRELVAAALALTKEQGVDDTTLWVSLALEAREGRPLSLLDAAKAAPGDETKALLRILEDRTLTGSPDSLEEHLKPLALMTQAQAYVMGAIMKGDTAPSAWRRLSSELLFASERPYFHVEAGEPDADGGALPTPSSKAP